MKNILLFVLFFLLGAGMMIGFSYLTQNSKHVSIAQPPKTKEPEFSLNNPPKDSKEGMIASMSGTVKWESRIATVESAINSPVQIEQGESLSTGDDGIVSVSFPDFVSFDLSENTDLNIIQTLPDHFVFEQPKGKIDYQVTDEPLSIRSLHTLIALSKGEAVVNVATDTGRITIHLPKGAAKVAYNNTDNISTIDQISEGQTYVFDDTTRTSVVK